MSVTVEDIAKGVGKVERTARTPRISVDGKTLAYANLRRNWIILDFAAQDVEGAPKRLSKGLEAKRGGSRLAMKVDEKSEKRAHDLLAWAAKNR